jgi:hypothetical protein
LAIIAGEMAAKAARRKARRDAIKAKMEAES